MITLAELTRAIGGVLTPAAEMTAAESAQLIPDGVTADSAAVEAGMLFVATPGYRTHGAKYAADAIHRGAIAVVSDHEGAGMIRESFPQGLPVPVLEVAEVFARIGEIAALCYGEPAKELRCFGITGTNGKTTTSFMLEHILQAAGRCPALIGGVELRIGGVHTATDITTPVPSELQRMLAEHLAAGGNDAVMEVTSHALQQHRTDPIRFRAAGFTQLSIDHLDYHPDIEHYFAAKSSLFTPERCEAAVILVDDAWGRRLYEQLAKSGQRTPRLAALAVTTELPPGAAGWQVRLSAETGHFTMHGTDGSVHEHECALPGSYNSANAALAVALALVGGVPAAQIPRSISPAVPGRMEVISEASPRVIVDFAHNADALEKALRALRPSTEGRLIVVTGTAGDRDASKRHAMGEACATNAELVIITDDDPHTEDPAQIRAALIAGTAAGSAQVLEIADRASAIHAAVRLAEPADTVIIAGRGHWTVQFVGHDLIDIDDREVAREALAARAHAAQSGGAE